MLDGRLGGIAHDRHPEIADNPRRAEGFSYQQAEREIGLVGAEPRLVRRIRELRRKTNQTRADARARSQT